MFKKVKKNLAEMKLTGEGIWDRILFGREFMHFCLLRRKSEWNCLDGREKERTEKYFEEKMQEKGEDQEVI